MLYNLVDFPAGVLPVSVVTREDEDALKRYEGHHKDPWDKLLKKEELCLRLMKEVENVTRMERQAIENMSADDVSATSR
ncbi:hypothetical protein GDO78_018936 [Eleutherodactylus coqui]|uniref:Uncharacterized protein n=1 Tax=Eleutherodactylus coqui TaxID=57060 RepID=A0A8J6E349_ELECQ|nr:hypothetical protein GDO78_018936 [Eleutherodactylus coqui]